MIEGYINEVIIEGDKRGRAGLFQEWAKKIKQSRPLNMKDMERYTLLANDLPGATVKSVLRPSKDVQGATDLVLAIEHKTLNASIGYDNRGTKSSGPGQATFSLGANSLLHLYEKTNLTYIASDDFDELHYFVFSHDQILGSEGTKLTLSANHSRTRPGDYLKDYDIWGSSTTFGMAVTHPFIRSRSANLNTNLNFDIKNSRTETMSVLQSEDRTRVLRAGIAYDFSDKLDGVNLFNVGVHQGFNILNATETGSNNLTRSEGYSDFTKFTAEISRTQKIIDRLGLSVAASGQYALCPLLSSEEFGFGGSQFGRAYDSSEITGDHGIALKAEFQFTDSFSVQYLKQIKYYQLYAFSDFGEVHGRSDLKSKRESAASAGVGIRFGITDYLSGYLEVDKPMTRKVATADADHGYDPRIFFSIVARY